MKILVTGANGYLGQGIVKSILELGHDVVAADFSVQNPPSLWPDRELRKYHCPCLALAPPPVAIRHLLLRNRYRPDGIHGVQSKARPNRNVPEEWVFSFQGTSGLSSLQSKFNKNPPVSRWPRRRTLVVLAGLHTVRFDFFSVLCSRIGAKKNTSLVSQRGIEDDSILFSVNWYPFIS